MIWPFRRRKKEKPLPPINEDWRVGDLAQRVTPGCWEPNPAGPAVGEICRVTEVAIGRFSCGNRGFVLRFAEYPAKFQAEAFRKLRPVHEACDVGFAALIKRPKREGIDA